MAREQQVPTLDRERLKLQFQSRVASRSESIDRLVDKILGVAAKTGCRDDDLTDVGIAAREALANAIVHGNEGDPGKHVRVSCYCDPGQGMLLVVRDEGEGFDPDQIPDPTHAERIHLSHGRGIFLMRHLMDHVEHRDGGREVALYKRCSDPQKSAKTKKERD